MDVGLMAWTRTSGGRCYVEARNAERAGVCGRHQASGFDSEVGGAMESQLRILPKPLQLTL